MTQASRHGGPAATPGRNRLYVIIAAVAVAAVILAIVIYSLASGGSSKSSKGTPDPTASSGSSSSGATTSGTASGSVSASSTAASSGSAPATTPGQSGVPAPGATFLTPTPDSSTTYTFNGTVSGGTSTATVVLTIGKPTPATTSDNCVEDGKADAVIPFQIKTTNTTKGFDVTVPFSVVINQWSQGKNKLAMQIRLQGETASLHCSRPDSPPEQDPVQQPLGTVAYVAGVDLPTGQSNVQTGQFILLNYYAAGAPASASSVLSNYPLRVILGTGGDSNMAYSASGPGVGGSGPDGPLFTLNGQSAASAVQNWTTN